MRRVRCSFISGVWGLFLLILSLGFLLFGTKKLTRMMAWESLTLRNGSRNMGWWRRPETPFPLKVYIFNVTNPESVSDGGQPVFSQVGPYVYEQYQEKVNVKKMEGFTLSYNQQNSMNFRRDPSGKLKESDLVTVINVPLAAVLFMVYEAMPESVGFLESIWRHLFPKQKNIFITTTVRELLFDGITIDCSSREVDVFFVCKILERQHIRLIRKKGKHFKFSFFYNINGTEEETYRVYQGISDVRKSGQIIDKNNSSSLHIWKNIYCNMINGTDGTQFPLLLDQNQRIYFFDKVLCRSFYAEFEEKIDKSDVTLYKYSVPESLFASPMVNPENKCFCRSRLSVESIFKDFSRMVIGDDESDTEICFENGVSPLMPLLGVPLVASFPHFYLGDPIYINYSGLTPIKELHETCTYVEPTSGVTVSSFKRIQLNLEVKRIPDVEITSNLREGLFPLLWTEEEKNLSVELFKFLKFTLIKKKVLEYGTLVSIAVAVSLIVFYLISSLLVGKYGIWKVVRESNLEIGESHVRTIRTPMIFWNKTKVSARPELFES